MGVWNFTSDSKKRTQIEGAWEQVLLDLGENQQRARESYIMWSSLLKVIIRMTNQEWWDGHM